MIGLLLYASMTCIDASDLISRVEVNDIVSEIVQTEVIETIKDATPHCNWDAND